MKKDSTKTLRLITVDDSQVIAEGLKYILSEIENIELIGNAFNVQAALYLIQKERPHVVILDINFKNSPVGSNGINLLVTLKEKYPKIIIIMLTNLSAAIYHKICIEAGADYFLDKSHDFNKIPELIEQFKNDFFHTN